MADTIIQDGTKSELIEMGGPQQKFNRFFLLNIYVLKLLLKT